jgi:iron(III) transport system substrate-binding protein
MLLLAIISAQLLAACGLATTAAPTAQPTAGRQTLTVYTAHEEETLKIYSALFEKTHPEIELKMVTGSTGVITDRFLAEKADPQADVIWGVAASSLILAEKAGLLEPYAPAGLDRVEPTFRDDADPPQWVGIDVWESAFCVNEALLKSKNLPVPTSWADLIKPIYKDSIVMPDPAKSGTGLLSVSALIQLQGEEQAWKYLDALDKNIVQYVPSGSRPCKMAAAGEIAIGISFGYRAILEKQKTNTVTPVWPSEGSGWDIEANALVKKATINPAAKTFLDWAISDSIVKEYAKNFPITTVKSGLPLPQEYPTDPLKLLIKNDLDFTATNRERILQEWSSRYQAKVVE